MTTCRVHSLESFGAADGPGVRYVIFLQGCRMRCQFCHNPDTWEEAAGTVYTAEELLSRALRYKNYWGDQGGITVSGGEPLLQMDFLLEFFTLAKEKGIHTVLDTAGQPFTREEPFFGKLEKLMKVTDLLLLDLKEMNPERHRRLTGRENSNILEFARYLSEIGKPVWIRHVVVPGITFDEKELTELGLFLKTLRNVEKLEVLPYHSMGKVKYDNLGMDYVLKDTPQLTKAEAKEAENMIRAAMK